MGTIISDVLLLLLLVHALLAAAGEAKLPLFRADPSPKPTRGLPLALQERILFTTEGQKHQRRTLKYFRRMLLYFLLLVFARCIGL